MFSGKILKMKPPPQLISLDHDDYHAKHVGVTTDGRQFFATTPFIPAHRDAGREFHALYIFDRFGNLLEAQINDLGTRTALKPNIEAAIDQKLAALGKIEFRRITIKPFVVEQFGVEFGFILRSPQEYLTGNEKPEDVAEIIDRIGWRVNVEPGNYMSFVEPWNDGGYET